MNRIICCIPARMGSSRLYGKPMLKINDKTIINLVHDQVKKVSIIDKIIVLTDSSEIQNEVQRFGGECVVIDEKCLNGTERIIRYIKKINMDKYDIILNVQGDEPFIDPDNIKTVLENYVQKKSIDDNIVCSTLYYETTDKNEIFSRSRGKIVLNKNSDIMYCSRNIIPSLKNAQYDENIKYNINIGIFAYDHTYLINWYEKENTYLQLLEDVEWLKIIEQGFKINAVLVDNCEKGVDTIEDYNYLVDKYQK